MGGNLLLGGRSKASPLSDFTCALFSWCLPLLFSLWSFLSLWPSIRALDAEETVHISTYVTVKIPVWTSSILRAAFQTTQGHSPLTLLLSLSLYLSPKSALMACGFSRPHNSHVTRVRRVSAVKLASLSCGPSVILLVSYFAGREHIPVL